MMRDMLIICSLLSVVSGLKLANPDPEFNTENSVYDEDCGDRMNYKCWKKGGHSLDKFSPATMRLYAAANCDAGTAFTTLTLSGAGLKKGSTLQVSGAATYGDLASRPPCVSFSSDPGLQWVHAFNGYLSVEFYCDTDTNTLHIKGYADSTCTTADALLQVGTFMSTTAGACTIGDTNKYVANFNVPVCAGR